MYRRELEINGTSLSFETGKYAKQADGSVVVRMGDSVVLVTACASPNPREGIDFLPLTVDYKEYTYASGRIPGGFFKREGKPSEKEVLTSRVIDRPIRPLFPAGWRNESQIIALVLSADANYDPDVLAISGASAALALSSVPFQKTIAGVRVGKVEGAIHHQSHLRAAKKELVRSGDGGQQGRDRDGRGRGQGSDRRRDGPGARGRPRRHQADCRHHQRAGQRGRQAEARGSRKRNSITPSTAKSKRR
jgi:polyribonucleotide nucleotidyltransferase